MLDVVVPLACRCRAVKGSVDITGAIRVVCHCDDCQTYARVLERPDVLDAWGGTDVCQTHPARLQVTEGRAHIRCLRLSERGLHRWHTSCCSTPMANTLGPRVPFVGVLHTFFDDPEGARDALLGPGVRTQARFAPTPPPDAWARAPLGLMARAASLLARGWLQGAHRPHPFVDESGAFAVTPRVLVR